MTGKRYEAASKSINAGDVLSIEKAVSIVRKNSTAKFDETIELALNLGVDTRHADQMVRGVCALPHGTGKTIRVAVFARGDKATEATKAGADVVGAEDLMETILKGNIEFDRCIASPDMMPIVGRLGKVLGPRNLMPNPKVGTVTPDLASAVKAAKSGEIQFKAEKAGVVQVGIGKISFDKKKLTENFQAFINELKKSKPTGAKGVFIKKISMSSTMGKSMIIDNSM